MLSETEMETGELRTWVMRRYRHEAATNRIDMHMMMP